MSFPIRSPRHQTGGIVVFARVLDKIRLAAAGKLPAGYHVGIVPGNRTFDDRLCKFLGVDFDALSARTLAGGSDKEILEWAFAHGRQPDAEQIEVWNAFLTKRGWRDPATTGFEKSKADAGLADRAEILTFFDLMDAEEGRA
jgi:gluconokinase